MGDANISPGEEPNIETLRKLALLSMPKRQGRNLTLSNPSLKSEGPTVFPGPATKPEDKEEGELSSDDDAEGATTTLASVEPALNQDQDSLKSLIPLRERSKEMLAPGTNFTGYDSHEGVSPAAEAFLASLRIPVPKDDFVIKFDEDSDTDGEHQNALSSSSTQLGSNTEKSAPGSVGFSNSTPLSQATSAGPNQKPSGLKSEIDRMKKQIAAMERSKGKPPALPVVGKSPRVISLDSVRSSVSTATDTKSVVQAGSGNFRSGPDLESLRLQIAAKESELQQRRQRLAARGPEASKTLSDVKGTGVGVPMTSQPVLPRTNSSHLAVPLAPSGANAGSEKMLAPPRKEVFIQADGLIALASTGPAGVLLAGLKKDVRLSGVDSCVDDQNVTDDTPKQPSFRAGSLPNNVLGRQFFGKGTKRSHAGFESLESTKVARVDGGLSLADNLSGIKTSKGPGLSEILPITANGTCKSLPVQGSSQNKRKVDDIEMPCKAAVEMPGPSNSGGSDVSKKLKTSPEAVMVGRLPNPKHPGPLETLQACRPMSSAGLVQVPIPSERLNAAITSSSTQALRSATVADTTLRSVVSEGEDVLRVQKPVMVTEEMPSEGIRGAITAGHVQNTEVPISLQGLARIPVHDDEHIPKIQKPRFQYEGSYALAALAGVPVPDAGVTAAVPRTEPSVKRHDVVSSNQQVREGMEIKTGMSLRPSSVLLTPDTQLEHPEQSLGFDYSYADNWDVDPDLESFEQFQAQEEVLIKKLEEAQERRHRCELRERVARKEFRESQRALREVSAECDLLNQRLEVFLSRFHLVESRKYSRKQSSSREPWFMSAVDNTSLRLTGSEVVRPCSPEEPPTSFVHCAVSLPLHQTSKEPEPCDVIGEKSLAIQVAESRGTPAVKYARGTTVVQRLRKDSATLVAEDDEPISRVARSDGRSQEAVVHGHERDVVSGRDLKDITYVEKVRSPAFVPQTKSGDLHHIGATEAIAVASCNRNREPKKIAVKVSEGGTPDNLSPKDHHVTISSGDKTVAGFDIRLERTMVEGKQVQAKIDASLSLSQHSEEQGNDTLATACGMTALSNCELSSPNKSHAYVQNSKAGMYTAPGVQDEQGVPGSSASTPEMLVEEITNQAQDPCIVSGKTKQGFSPFPSRADEDCDHGLKSSALEALEVDSPIDQGVLRRSSHDLEQSTPKENVFDVPDFQDRDDGDGLEKGYGKGVHSCMVDGDYDETSKSGKLTAVDEDGPLDHSVKAGSRGKEGSDNSEDLAVDYQGLSSEAVLMNGVEQPDLDSVVNVRGELTDGRCLLLKHQQLRLLRAVSEEIKISPTVSISGSSRQILSETRRGSCADSEDLSTCTDHVRPQDQSKTMSSNKSADEEAMCQSTRSAGGFGDMDTMELDEEIHSSDKLEMSKKVKLVQFMEKFESNSGIENLSCLSQPSSGPALEMRQKSSVGEIPSMERQNLPLETVLETKEQYFLSLQFPGGDKVVKANDRCSSEFEESNVSLDHGPTEKPCPPQTGPGQEQSVLAPFDSNRQRLIEESPVDEDVVRREGVDKLYSPTAKDDEDPGKRSLAFHGMEDVQTTVINDNRGREDESADVVFPDREAESYQQDRQSVDALESRDSNSEKDIENSIVVEVEVFKKASLEGNVHKTSSRDEEAVAMIGVQTPTRDADNEQIMPQLQTHLLDQLLNMVGVRTQGAAVYEEGLSLKDPLISLLGDDGIVGAQSTHVESPEPVAESAEKAQVPCGGKTEVLYHVAVRGPLSDNSSGSEHWVPSAVTLVSLRCVPRIVDDTSDTPMFERISNSEEKEVSLAVGSPAVLPRYESPLSIFRSYRSYPQFAGAMRLSSSSSTWSHAINPHKPLCRFEHRGQCRNDHCPWQHADDYTLSSSQIVVELPNKAPRKLPSKVSLAVNMDGTPPSPWPKTGSSRFFSVIPQNPGVESSDKVQKSGSSLFAPNVSSSQGSSSRKCHDYEISVPTYRIGYYTLKAEDPARMRLGIPGIQRKGRTEIYNSFLLSPSIHRTLPPDFPCLLDTTKSKLSTVEASDASELPNWRYTGKIQEERVFNESTSLHGSKDVEMWLELALNHIDFDIASENPKARDEALCILSRGLETKQNSVTLWMAYSCLFHTRRDNPESDDMFQFAIQYIPGSYELWLLYINSRPDLAARMEAYEGAVVALVENGTQVELLREDSSACLLDIALQMLYCMCVSGRIEDALSWVDDLIHDASTTDQKEFHRGSTSALLSHLTPHDACILWISCTYLAACGEMPVVISRRLGCKHELPCNLDWDTHARSDKVDCSRVMKTLTTAASSGRGCLSLEDPVIPMSDKINHSKEVLGVNYVQCIAFCEGLESAAGTSQHLVDLYPTSVELILLYARIEERRAGSDAGLNVFEEAVSNWPAEQPGIQRLRNQFAVHGLLWGGNNLAHRVLCKSLPRKVQQPVVRIEDPPSRTVMSEANVPAVRPDESTLTSLENASSDTWSQLREHYLSLTSRSARSEEYTAVQSGHDDDSVYALINLALVEALSGDRAFSQYAIMRAMKIAVQERDTRQCWKELASLQISGANVEHNMLRLLDRCKTESYILSQLKPLSLKVLDDLKRPHVRKFFVGLLGPLPTDHSLLNCILEICYGPTLLPSEFLTMKDVFHFAEGILEAMPGNVELALSLCKLVFQEGGSPKSKSLSSAIWASALLISSLQQSCPVAPEVYWVEAGLLLSHLRKEKSLEEYYVHALVKYPFSAALRQGLEEVRLQILESEVARGGLQQADMVREAAGPIEV